MKLVIVLSGIGYGDETKGATTDLLCRHYSAHTVIRTGGPQALHAVVIANGQDHIFQQFGAGTLAGADTYLSSKMIVDPFAIWNEGRALEELGVSDAFDRMAIDRDCLVITPFQAIANRLREMTRGDGRYGTVGIGVGETVCDSEQLGDEAIWIRDIGTDRLREKLANIRRFKLHEMTEIIKLAGDSEYAQEQIAQLRDPELIEQTADVFEAVAKCIRVVNRDHLGCILQKDGVAIFEPSQGALLSRWFGFHPYTTLANPMQSAAIQLLQEQNYSGDLIRLALMRGYQTRHGAGPFVVEDPEMNLPDVHNGEHRWQGKFRVGPLDAVATRYAIEVSGGPKAFDGLVVSCLDRLGDIVQICDSYAFSDGEKDPIRNFFKVEDGRAIRILPHQGPFNQERLNHQARLAQILGNCRPIFTPVSKDKIIHEIETRFDIPVVLTAHGPTAEDRTIVSNTLLAGSSVT